MLRVRTVITVPSGGPYLSTLNFTAATDSQANATAAANAARDFWQQWTSVWLTSVSFTTDPNVDIVNPADGKVQGQLLGNSYTAPGITSGADMLPPANQALLRWNTNDYVGGHRIRGRTFIGGLNESSNAAGVPSGQIITNNAPLAIGKVVGLPDVQLCVWSRPRKATPSLPFRAGSTHTVTSGALQPKFAILRSRRD